MSVQIEEVCILLKRLTEVAHQIIDDVEDAGKTGDHALFYDRMVCNSEDLVSALTTAPKLVTVSTRQGEKA